MISGNLRKLFDFVFMNVDAKVVLVGRFNMEMLTQNGRSS